MIGFLDRKRHSRLQILLSAYIDGEVTPSEAARVEEHLAGCRECVGELSSLRATSSLLRSLPELEVPRSFALTEAPAPVRFAPQLVWTTRFATSLAALFLVALLLGDVLGYVGQTRSQGSRELASRAVQAPAAPAKALESGLAGLPGSPGNPGLAPAPAAASAPAAPAPAAPVPAPAAPAPAAPAPAAPAPAAPAPAAPAPAAPAPAATPAAETLTLEARALPAPAPAAAPAPALAAAEAETAGETEDLIAPQTLAAPAAPDVEEPSPEVESAAAPERSTQAATSRSAIDESAEQAERAEGSAAPLPSPAPALPPSTTEETATPVDEPVAGAAAARDGVSEGEVAGGLAIPVRELEIVLGVLVVLLLAVTYCVSRRGVREP